MVHEKGLTKATASLGNLERAMSMCWLHGRGLMGLRAWPMCKLSCRCCRRLVARICVLLRRHCSVCCVGCVILNGHLSDWFAVCFKRWRGMELPTCNDGTLLMLYCKKMIQTNSISQMCSVAANVSIILRYRTALFQHDARSERCSHS